MATFYKGVAYGTFLHAYDLRLRGLTPRNPGGRHGLRSIISHVRYGTVTSCYMSLTKSYGVAENYAQQSRVSLAAAGKGHVYEIEIDDPAPSGITIIDPIHSVVTASPNPLAAGYGHNGDMNFLLGIVDHTSLGHHLSVPAKEPPGSGATPQPPHLSEDLEVLVRALRDAEVLVIGNLPHTCFVHRWDV